LNHNTFYKSNIYEEKTTNPLTQTSSFKGYTIYSEELSSLTYIINNDGDILHTWESNYPPGHSVYLLENGYLLRPILLGIHPTFFITGGIGGGVQKFDLNNNLVWDFVYSDTYYVSHHDIEPLPNGNVLMIAWDYKTENEAIANGRNPEFISWGQLWPDYIIEVEPTGPTTGEIVWEWHVWDHLIQDFDPTKENYGDVADHPELIDINYVYNPTNLYVDWLHTNSIDYNEEFDQILLSVRNFCEIWVIDHSTTTEEAAGHLGGNSGKGGDILYRWGNPKAYGKGTDNDKQFFEQHDARWIVEGCPGAGNILVFNNGNGRPNPVYSSIDEIVPSVDEYGTYDYSGSAYGPDNPTWTYTASYPGNFYSELMSGSQRLPNGNTLICSTEQFVFFEVTSNKETVWEYNVDNSVFKINRYAIDYPGIQELIPEPYKPEIPDGKTNGRIGINYTYTTNSTDPNDDQIYYWFDWGDGTDSGWLGPYDSGENCSAVNMWTNEGGFSVKVKAKDGFDHVSIWSNPLTVNIAPPNDPPYMPNNPNPLDNETEVNINAILSWSGGDPNANDTVTYDVYFEADDPTPDILLSNDQLETTYDPGSMDFNTHYYWKIVSTDNNGDSTNGPIWNFITEETPTNSPPEISLENPENGANNISLALTELSIYISDPEYDKFNWSIETHPDIGSSSGTFENDGEKVCKISNDLIFSTTYTWYVNTSDTGSGYNIEKQFVFTTIINEPPRPPTIVGPYNLKTNEVGTYTFSAVDPDSDIIYIYIDWDDGDFMDWDGPYSSEETVNVSHSWSTKKNYVIRAKAKDVNDFTSTWGTFDISIPRSKESNFYALQRFINTLPLIKKILNLIL